MSPRLPCYSGFKATAFPTGRNTRPEGLVILKKSVPSLVPPGTDRPSATAFGRGLARATEGEEAAE